MKKAVISIPHWLAYVILIIFIVLIIVLLFQKIFPQIFGKDVCKFAQMNNLNKLIGDASATAGETIELFKIEDCVEEFFLSSTNTYCLKYVDEEFNAQNNCRIIAVTFELDEKYATNNYKLKAGMYKVRISPFHVKFL